MKTSLVIGTLLLAAAGASSLGALPLNPNGYQGSDTLFDLTTQVLTLGLTGTTNVTYIGGGSGNGQQNMVVAGITNTGATSTQVSAPMSRMMNNGAGICTTAGVTLAGAQGIVIGLDAVDILASAITGASAACNSTGEGLVNSGSAAGVPVTNWKTVLSLVYGGESDTANPGQVICNGPKRTAIVNNWSSLFQDTCANTSQKTSAALGAACADSNHVLCSVTRGQFLADGVTPQVGTCTKPSTIPLWHAFRRDDQSGTSDVFATLLGLSPSTSATSNRGFGASPYCNAVNWDVSTANGTSSTNFKCLLGPDKQFTGPGGVYNSLSGEAVGSQVHRRPPPNTWGDWPSSATTNDSEVLPTSMQDNDPIRRPCVGTTVGVATKEAEEVCNIDLVSVGGKTVGQLGLVVAIPDAAYIKDTLNKNLFPTGTCNGSEHDGPAPAVYDCAPDFSKNAGGKHAAECPDGDDNVAGSCGWAISATDSTNGNCQADPTIGHNFVQSPRGYNFGDGRVFNIWFTDQINQEPVTLLTQGYSVVKPQGGVLAVALSSAQGMSRIHLISTIPAGQSSLVSPAIPGCSFPDSTDQIGCLVAADQCSIGYAGNGGTLTGNNAALLINNITPTPTTVSLLGKAGEYPLSRKLYFNTIEGWNTVNAGSANTGDIAIAAYESTPANMNGPSGLLETHGFFNFGSELPGTAAGSVDPQFCEDFNEEMLCTSGQVGFENNVNACAANTVAGIPGAKNTVCGNGIREAYEECDDGTTTHPASGFTGNGGSGDGCTNTCRCVGVFNEATGVCNAPATSN